MIGLLACAPPALPDGAPGPQYGLWTWEGQPAGALRQATVDGGFTERAALEHPDRPAAALELWLPRGDPRSARLLHREARAWSLVKWRSPLWQRRQGAILRRFTLDQTPDALVLDGPLGTTPGLWTLSLQGGPGERAALELDSGRTTRLRLETRGPELLTRDGVPVPTTRWFAWTAAQGASLWVDAEGALLAASAPTGLEWRLPGVERPRPATPAPPPGVVEAPARLERPDLTLHGTWSTPAAAPPRAQVLLLPGSGPADRDGNFQGLGLGLYRDLAWHLSARGYAVLRADKRGVAQSVGNTPPDGTVAELLGDAQGWLDQQPDACWLVIGHSEGGMLAPTLRHPGLAGVVTLAGPPVPLAEVIVDQAQAIALAHGATGPEAEHAARTSEAALRAVRAGRERELGLDPLNPRAGLPWLRSHLTFDPIEGLRTLSAPLLALFAEHDLQVRPQWAEQLAVRLGGAGPSERTVLVLPGLDHLLMPTDTPGLGVYQDPDRTLGAPLWAALDPWLDARTCPGIPVGPALQ